MGLDIYCYRVEKKYAHLTPDEIRENRENDAKNKFAKKCVKWLKMLKEAHKGNAHTYYDTYQTFLVQLKKDEYFKTYDWKIEPYSKAILSPMEVLVEFEKTKRSYFKVEDAYFRKVNFIYAFFQDDLVDEECLVSADDIKELIDTCVEVLKHHKTDSDEGYNYAMANLPTQGGFFFGSTKYDNWYWHDVEDCLTQMRKLHKKLKEGDMVQWYFSW